MSVVKRSAALVLAMLMIIMTASALTAQMAYAAGVSATNGTVISSAKTFKNGEKVSFTFEVTHSENGLSGTSVTTSAVGSIQASDFKTDKGTVKVTEILTSGVSADISKYKVTVTDAEVVSGTDGKSSIKVKIVNAATSYDSGTITVSVSGYQSEEDPTPPPVPVASNAKYSIARVMSSKKSGNNDVPNTDRIYFDKSNISSSSDASIRQTYFADITLRVFDENAPADLTTTDILGLSAGSLDMGSFTYKMIDSNTSIDIVDSVSGYYEIVLKGVRYSGNSNKLTLRVKKGTYIGDITAEISECITKKEAAAESDKNNNSDSDPKLEVETPYVIVNKYSYGGGNVIAGDTFPLNLTIYNTSETQVVGNMMITMTMPEGLMLTSSSNTFYVEELDKHASINKTVQVTAKADAKAQSHNVAVAMKYQYVDERVNARRSAETTENIAIPVVQVDRFQVTAVEIPMEVMMGEETSVTVNFVNKGRSEAYNLSAEINGNIQNPGQTQNLGNLASGIAGTADFFILPQEAGMCTGEIKISYEDTNMEEKVATIRYSTNVKSPEEFMGGDGGMMVGPGSMMPGEGEIVPEEPKSSLPIIILGVVIVAVPVLIIVKKKLDKKRKEREDADL